MVDKHDTNIMTCMIDTGHVGRMDASLIIVLGTTDCWIENKVDKHCKQ